MREIKFRIWNKEKNSMVFQYTPNEPLPADEQRSLLYINTYTEDAILIYEECDEDGNSIGKHKYNYLSNKSYELMQFTGLYDKNGKEIYEGDIVKIRIPGMPQGMTEKQVIMFVHGSFVCGDYPSFLILQGDLPGQTGLEIIGNIYENKDLLDEKY